VQTVARDVKSLSILMKDEDHYNVVKGKVAQ
jgi:hypothetical protein